jgi:hypothetical protein
VSAATSLERALLPVASAIIIATNVMAIRHLRTLDPPFTTTLAAITDVRYRHLRDRWYAR